MASLTLSIPEELKHKMEHIKYVNWSAVARKAIMEKVEILEKMDKILSKSTLTEADTIKYGRIINKRIWKRHQAIHKAGR
jgi:hypothetical protein